MNYLVQDCAVIISKDIFALPAPYFIFSPSFNFNFLIQVGLSIQESPDQSRNSKYILILSDVHFIICKYKNKYLNIIFNLRNLYIYIKMNTDLNIIFNLKTYI